ncbi:epoxide hydrolase family protein [Lentzea flava]|uniref:Hydrolase n=1 Tax=Lentzea flava TaxID=103732 RepID=A0ABQ2U973_9PSEU|nr:epoxide hydrolase [Lentzea flava]MCP2197083.1 Tat (twin-arginine translocation) pathway signal sequence [Lentzea flava]GGU13466.1 hydrolase [Lentzea flava]
MSTEPSRRSFLSASAAAALTFGLLRTSPAQASSDIRPFRVRIPERDVAEMRRRVLATRWPDAELVADLSQGPPQKTVKALARYWAHEYDWRTTEAKLNALPQFMTEIDGLDIHFVHVRSKHDNALPLLVSHGWPGSVIEQLKIIGPLTDPTAHGGKAEDAFHLVIPSMPGYGFSGKPTTTGWGPDRIAGTWIELMKRLGYDRYVAQGGDWGALIVDLMALRKPAGLLGVHTNLPGAVPVDIDNAARAGGPQPPGLQGDELKAWQDVLFRYSKGQAYARMMGLRPQTLSGFADSPAGLASFMIDHNLASLAQIVRAFDGHREGLTRQDIVENVSLYWLTNTAISAARLYWESKYSVIAAKGVTLPVAVSVFPEEVYQAPRSWAERAYPNLIHYNRVAKGGHFAAWEQPQILAEEVRAGFRQLR